ncbi:hypothetical protein Tco_1236377 [Tanacetum coccineum]
MSFFQIIRANGSAKRYSSMIQMLRDFDREDLETLWKLVKAKHGYTRPEEGYERVLWGDLKTMFEPDVKDMGRIVGIKRLQDVLKVTAAKVRVTAVKQNLVLFSNLSEKYAKYYYCLKKVNAADKVTTADRVTTAENYNFSKIKTA